MEHEAPSTLHAFCVRILEAGDLETKLRPPGPRGLEDLPQAPRHYDAPARDPDIALSARAERLPRPTALCDPRARARCLARFAHHELMAVELFAWALLRWPELPGPLRTALASILTDEQRHCRLYLERLSDLGDRLSDHPRSNYFWRHAGTLAQAEAGPRAFLCAMGLTLEQANLDFSALYRDGFEAAGDLRSAAVCDAVHRDEIQHVRVAARWLCRLSPGRSDLEAYTEASPFPFVANRAKGRRFDAEARRRAGLSEAFIASVRRA